MYRILRKLVELGFLEKKINYSNHRFSRFYETDKTIELKQFSKSKIDLSNMVLEKNKIHDEITFLEKQNEKYLQLEKKFPGFSHQILDERNKCLGRIIELKAYRSALKSVIEAI